MLAPLSESYIWLQLNTYSKTGIIIGLFLLIVLFINIVLIFMPLGQVLGNTLNKTKNPILAYSMNILASIAGLWAFQAYSLIRFTPYFAIVLAMSALFFIAKDRVERYLILGVVVATIAFIVPKTGLNENFKTTYWSLYQKLTISTVQKDFSNPNPQPAGWYLEVNNVGYMGLLDISNEYKRKAQTDIATLYGDKSPVNLKFADTYSLPLEFKKSADDILIIGAGGGNDAAALVRRNSIPGSDGTFIPDSNQKVPKVDAVEIDPTIIEIGKKYHPEEPYRDPSVNVIVEDGRTYMERTNKKYDMVIMGLADSHTLSSSLTNLRLDHYLYTKESFEQVKEILKDDGVFFLTFEVARPWIGNRLTKGLTDVFGQDPKIFEVRSQGVYGWGGYSFVVSKNPQVLNSVLENNHDLNEFVSSNRRVFQTNTRPLTDNWPYLYLDKPRLPILHIIISLILGSALLLLKGKMFVSNKLNIPMFFWGAAFLLFEFQNISKASLLFGVTWQTNLFMISAILILLLIANWTVSKKILSIKLSFVLLILSLVVQIALPLNTLNNLGLWLKIIFASLVLNLPLFFGGMIFADMFARTKDKANAFGSNFIGAVFGGFAEMLSFLFGIHALLYAVIILYSLGFLASNYVKINYSRLKFR